MYNMLPLMLLGILDIKAVIRLIIMNIAVNTQRAVLIRTAFLVLIFRILCVKAKKQELLC